MSSALRFPVRQRCRLATLALMAAATGCASSPAPTPTTTPAGVVAVSRDIFVPVNPGPGAATIHDFAIAPWHYDRFDCMPLRTTPSGAVMETVEYPSRRAPQVSVSLTLDSAGRLVRSSETHGVFRFRPPTGDTTRSALDSALRAQAASQQSTMISLDYVVDPGLLIKRGGRRTLQTLAVSTRAVADLPSLDRPAEHAREAMRDCHVGRAYADTAIPGPGGAPDDVARQFFRAIGDEDWTAAVAYFDSTTLQNTREQGIRNLLGWAKEGAPTQANRRPGQSTAIGWNSDADTANLAKYDTVSVVTPYRSTTIGALARLSAAAFAARTLEATYARGTGRTNFTVLGYVSEGTALAHVVYRMDRAGVTYFSLNMYRPVLHLRREAGAWKIIADFATLSPGNIVNAAVNYRPPAPKPVR